MNITEAIKLNNKHGKNRMPIDVARQFWAEKQEKSYNEDTIIQKTFDGIKLVESLVKRDAEHKFFVPENLQVVFRTEVLPKPEGKKVAPHTDWIDLVNLSDGKVVYSMSYLDAATGKSVVKNVDGQVVAEGKGWKKIRDHFLTEKVKAEVVEEVKEPKIKKASKVKKSEASEAPVEKELETPEIPEELL